MKKTNRTRSLYPVLLLTIAVLLFASCAPQAQPSAPSKGNANADLSTLESWGAAMKEQFGGQEITVAMATHPGTESMQNAMSAEFTNLTGIKVNWKVVNETQLKTDILLDFTSGSGQFDIIMVDGFWMSEFAVKKVLDPIRAYVDDSTKTPPWYDFEDIIAAYRNGIGAYNGVELAVPVAGETRYLAYRTDLFEKYGKEPPKTMQEYLELAQFFNGKEEGLYGVAMRAAKGIHCASGWMTIMYNFSDGYMDQKTKEPTMTDPKTVESLQFFVDLLKNAPPDVATFTHEEAVGTFIEGKSAMWLDATALTSRILDKSKSKVYDKVGFVPTPTGPDGLDAAALAGWNLGVAVNSKKKDAAWAFIVYMTGKPTAKTYVKNGGTPVRESIYNDAEMAAADPSYPVQLESFKRAAALVDRGIAWLPPSEKLNQMLDIVGSYANQAIIGQISAQEACDKSQEELKDLGL